MTLRLRLFVPSVCAADVSRDEPFDSAPFVLSVAASCEVEVRTGYAQDKARMP